MRYNIKPKVIHPHKTCQK